MNRTWIGGGDNQASNPNDWSPAGAPQPGDALDMPTGSTMNIIGNALAGDSLHIGDSVLGGQSPAVFDVSGRASFNLDVNFPPYGVSSTTVNLADHSEWIGGFSSAFVPAFVSGGRFSNTSSTIDGGHATITSAVIGHGSFTVSTAQSASGVLEFAGSVSRHQAVHITGGDPSRGSTATAVIDHPDEFHGSVTLAGELDLQGLTADSYSLKQDLLTLYAGNQIVDRINFDLSPQAMAFGVSQTASGIAIHADGALYRGGGELLPVHG
jgi:hypothetical protein